jgi:hypothetical protein
MNLIKTSAASLFVFALIGYPLEIRRLREKDSVKDRTLGHNKTLKLMPRGRDKCQQNAGARR